MSGLDRDQLAAARLWATSRQPYLASALFALQATARPGIATIAIDPRWRIYHRGPGGPSPHTSAPPAWARTVHVGHG